MGLFSKIKNSVKKAVSWGKEHKILKKIANVATGGAIMMSAKLTKGTAKLIKTGITKIQERKAMSKYNESESDVEGYYNETESGMPENMDGALYDESVNAQEIGVATSNNAATVSAPAFMDILKKYWMYIAGGLGALILLLIVTRKR